MRIKQIRLFGSHFAFADEADVRPKIESYPETERKFSLNTDVEVVDQSVKGSQISFGLVVEAHGLIKDVEVWSIGCAYQGTFTIDEGADITVEHAMTRYGPAQVYAFAREFIADISRRAGFRQIIYIPPWNFTASQDTKADGQQQ